MMRHRRTGRKQPRPLSWPRWRVEVGRRCPTATRLADLIYTGRGRVDVDTVDLEQQREQLVAAGLITVEPDGYLRRPVRPLAERQERNARTTENSAA